MTSATWGQSWSTSFREPFKARGQTHGNALALHGYPLRTVALVAGRGGERVMTDLRDLAHYAPELAEAFEFTANEERMPEIHVALATADELRELLSAAARREQYFLDRFGPAARLGAQLGSEAESEILFAVEQLDVILSLARHCRIRGLGVAAVPAADSLLQSGSPCVAAALIHVFAPEADAEARPSSGRHRIPRPCSELMGVALGIAAANIEDACQVPAFKRLSATHLARLLAYVPRGAELFTVCWSIDLEACEPGQYLNGPGCESSVGRFQLRLKTCSSRQGVEASKVDRWCLEVVNERRPTDAICVWSCDLSVGGRSFENVTAWPSDTGQAAKSGMWHSSMVSRLVPATSESSTEVHVSIFPSAAQRRIEALGTWLLSPEAPVEVRCDEGVLSRALRARRASRKSDGSRSNDTHEDELAVLEPVMQKYADALWPSRCTAVFRRYDVPSVWPPPLQPRQCSPRGRFSPRRRHSSATATCRGFGHQGVRHSRGRPGPGLCA